MKTFQGDFFKFLRLLGQKKKFALARFSDGEMYIMQDKEVILSPSEIRVGDRLYPGGFPDQDKKHYIPEKHQNWNKRLFASYQYKSSGYYKGLPCRCCIGDENHQWMLDQYGEPDAYMTWSNIFINANYPRFITEMVPIMTRYPIVLVCHKEADLTETPFNIVKDFRIGENAMINDLDVIDKAKKYIKDNNIKDHLFLFAASSLSNFLTHELWKVNKNNTYLDIGTTLHKYLKLNIARDYLQGYWNNKGGSFANRICIW